MILGVIQVRMGAKRLPNKVLLDVNGKPMLWHICNRLKSSKLLDKFVIATSTKDRDKAIVEFAKKYDIEYYCGSENDLIDRIYQTTKKFNATAIVRITADNPLLDPKIIDKMIKYYLNHPGLDYVGFFDPMTYPSGIVAGGIISFDALERLWKDTKGTFYRELFRDYMVKHPKKYKLANLKYEKDLSNMRWTVDYQEDLYFVREVFKRLGHKKIFYMEDILDLLKKHPEIENINKKHINLKPYKTL